MPDTPPAPADENDIPDGIISRPPPSVTPDTYKPNEDTVTFIAVGILILTVLAVNVVWVRFIRKRERSS